MSFTRRSLLRNAAALSAAGSFGFAPEFLNAQGPLANAIYVLFEGPWLFDPNAAGIRATTLGADMPDAANHVCEVGIWDATAVGLKPGSIQMSNGQNVALTATGARAASSFLSLFTTAFAINPFLWFANGSPRVTPAATDRTVTFPIPTGAFFTGRLVSPTFADPARMLKTTVLGTPQPFSTAIFAYVPATAGGSVTLNVGGTPMALKGGDHLILRLVRTTMGSMTPAQDGAHVQAVFNTLKTRIGTSAPTMNTLTSTDFSMGASCPITSLPELGIPGQQPGSMKATAKVKTLRGRPIFRPMFQTTANCQGGGGPVGP